MKTNTRLLGAYQVIAGICSLVTLWSVMSARGSTALVMLVLLSALAIVAGICLWREMAHRWQLTIINQLVQVVGVYSPWLTFTVIHGASLTVASRAFAEATFAESIFTQAASFSVGASVCDVSSGAALSGLPTYAVSLNLLALGILFYAVVARKRANKAPEPTRTAVTDRADARSAPAARVAHL